MSREIMRAVLETKPTRSDDYEAFAENYFAAIASAMYHFAQGDDDASMNVNLARFDSHGNLSEDEFDILILATRWDGFGVSLQLVKDSYSWLFAAIDGYLTY